MRVQAFVQGTSENSRSRNALCCYWTRLIPSFKLQSEHHKEDWTLPVPNVAVNWIYTHCLAYTDGTRQRRPARLSAGHTVSKSTILARDSCFGGIHLKGVFEKCVSIGFSDSIFSVTLSYLHRWDHARWNRTQSRPQDELMLMNAKV